MYFKTEIVTGKQNLLDLIKNTVKVPDFSKIGENVFDEDYNLVPYKPENVVVHNIAVIPGDTSISLGGSGHYSTMWYTTSQTLNGHAIDKDATYVVTFAVYEEDDLLGSQKIKNEISGMHETLTRFYGSFSKTLSLYETFLRVFDALENRNERKMAVAADCMIADIRAMLQGDFDNSYATENNCNQAMESNDDSEEDDESDEDDDSDE